MDQRRIGPIARLQGISRSLMVPFLADQAADQRHLVHLVSHSFVQISDLDTGNAGRECFRAASDVGTGLRIECFELAWPPAIQSTITTWPGLPAEPVPLPGPAVQPTASTSTTHPIRPPGATFDGESVPVHSNWPDVHATWFNSLGWDSGCDGIIATGLCSCIRPRVETGFHPHIPRSRFLRFPAIGPILRAAPAD